MTRTSKRLAELAARNQAAATERLQAAREAGFDHFKECPDELMTTIHRRASNIYPDNKDEALAYAHGYLEARIQRDEYLREQRQ